MRNPITSKQLSPLSKLTRLGINASLVASGLFLVSAVNAVSYTHLTLPTTPYV